MDLWTRLWGRHHVPQNVFLVLIDFVYLLIASQQLLPMMRKVSGEFFIFQQDNAPTHRARDTVRLLKQATPAFIPSDLWPPSSPDLNPVDCKIWGGASSRSESTSHGCTVSTNWSSVCFMFGMAWTKASNVLQIYRWVCQWKDFENRLRNDRVTAMSLVSSS